MSRLMKKEAKISRGKKFLYNTSSSLLLQMVNIVCGFILPRVILKNYGSETNGVVTTITQYLAFINFMDLGVGAVTQSAYYWPLSCNNFSEINSIYNESLAFFKRIAVVLIGYVTFLCLVFPKIIQSTYSAGYIVALVLILSFNQFAQFFFVIPDQLLLSASQRGYILNVSQIILVIMNTIVCVVIIILGKSIHIVKLVSAMIFFINPIVLRYNINRLFTIDRRLKVEGAHIPQKKNGIAQHCATVVMNNTDVVILSVFSTLANVSVYAVYNLVYSGVKQLISTAGTSFTPLIGSVYTEDNKDKLKYYFNYFEWAMHLVIVIIYTITGLLIVPFVMNYTRGIYDAQYSQPIFAVIMTIAFYIYSIRIPYISMVNAAGHFKQTQNSAIIEAIVNITVSVIFVYKLGLVGVAIGTLVAIIYRTAYLSMYLKNNILNRSPYCLFKNILIDFIETTVSRLIIHFTMLRVGINPNESYKLWIFSGLICGLVVACVVLVTNSIFYKNNLIILRENLTLRFKRKR